MNNELLNQLEKKFGTSDKYRTNYVNSDILTSLLELEQIPRKILIEIYGKEDVGKSTLLLHLIKEAQLKKYLVCLIDMDRSFDRKYASIIIPILDNLIIVHNNQNQDIIDMIITLLNYNIFDIIFIDSIATINSELLKQDVGKLKLALNNSNSLIIYTNQLRYFKKCYSHGGKKIKFYTTIRLKIQKLMKKNNIFNLECKIIKNIKPIKDIIKNIILDNTNE